MIKPDDFIEIVKKETEKDYSNLHLGQEPRSRVIDFFQRDRKKISCALYEVKESSGILRVSNRIHIYSSCRSSLARELKEPESLWCGVEYEIKPVNKSFNQSITLRNAKQYGFVLYNGYSINELDSSANRIWFYSLTPQRATVRFDLESEMVAEIEKHNFPELGYPKDWEGKNIKQGASKFFRIFCTSKKEEEKNKHIV